MAMRRKLLQEDDSFASPDLLPPPEMLFEDHLRSSEPLVAPRFAHESHPHPHPLPLMPPFVHPEDFQVALWGNNAKPERLAPRRFSHRSHPHPSPLPAMPPFVHPEDIQVALRGNAKKAGKTVGGTKKKADDLTWDIQASNEHLAEVVNTNILAPLVIAFLIGLFLIGYKMEQARDTVHRRFVHPRPPRRHRHASDGYDDENMTSSFLQAEDEKNPEEWGWLAG
jgi:hypothetical protein